MRPTCGCRREGVVMVGSEAGAKRRQEGQWVKYLSTSKRNMHFKEFF